MLFRALLLISLAAMAAQAYDLSVGNRSRVAYSEHVQLAWIPLTVREKTVSWSNPNNQPIRGVFAIDQQLGSKARPSISAGGLGFPYVTLRLKGERGGETRLQSRNPRLNHDMRVTD
ncbi:unnamed protein product [Plutella xylostella]|uniref:(diamondback moth) hypothetical protein n=1 Tax=Plutella xylostella TaxID=51655 RepID=A0A8S4DRV6_PLUXY|nr:unnamed protein product [Plutella xylostella]